MKNCWLKMNRNNGGPSLKKKFVGLIRNLSQPGCTSPQNIDNRTYTRPDTFIHKYLQGEGRVLQPAIIYGRSVDELPPRSLGRLGRRSFAAFTGPAGGLASVNRKNPSLEIAEPDVDFIDSEESLPDDQPNAYVTCQRPPPRKNLFGDIAEYFRTPKPPAGYEEHDRLCAGEGLHSRSCNGVVAAKEDDLALNGIEMGAADSDDSLDCEVPSWRGEAPSPLSPHPSNTPSNAFLRFGDGPLNYGLTLPGREDGRKDTETKTRLSSLASADCLETRSCENLFCSSSNPLPRFSPSSPCGGSLGSLEGVEVMEEEERREGLLVSCYDEGDVTYNNFLLDSLQNSKNAHLDMNYNPLITLNKSLLDSPSAKIKSAPLTPRNANDVDCTNIQSAPVSPRITAAESAQNKRDLTLINKYSVSNVNREVNDNWTDETGGCGGVLSGHQEKYLSLDLVEGCALAAPDPDLKRSEKEEIAGILNWNRPHDRAFGLSTTLYERHPVTHERAGNPIADAFGVIARENNAILALADGVNWGEEASLAAKCAVHGCINHINKALFSPGVPAPSTTTDLFVALLRSFHAAHSLILQEDGMLTTLTVAIVAPQSANPDKYVVCVCNVGDSLAYVYSQKYGVREITQGSHDIYSMRDMRDALGALGPVDGQNPELNNLTCSMTFCDVSDIVFLTSDGISDNFDPVVGKFVLPKSEPKERPSNTGAERTNQTKVQDEKRAKETSIKNGIARGGVHSGQHHRMTNHSRSHRTTPRQRQGIRSQRQNASNTLPAEGFRQPVSRSRSQPAVSETEALRHDPFLPFVEAHQRHELTLLRMEDLLRCGLTSPGPVVTAQALCYEMVHFATKLTVAKRRILEDPDLYPPAGAPQDLSRNDQRNRRRKVCEKLALVPGKLDHATVVAYAVEKFFPENSTSSDSEDELPMLNQPLPLYNLADIQAPLASPDSSRSILSFMDDAKSHGSSGPSSWRNPIGPPTLASMEEFDQERDSEGYGDTGSKGPRCNMNVVESNDSTKVVKNCTSSQSEPPLQHQSDESKCDSVVLENKNPEFRFSETVV